MLDYNVFLSRYTNPKGFVSIHKLIKDIKENNISVHIIEDIQGSFVVRNSTDYYISQFVILIQDKSSQMRLLDKKDNSIWISKIDKNQILDIYNIHTESFLDQDGLNYYGYNVLGFDSTGTHQNGTIYNNQGFNVHGYNQHGYHQDGSYDKTQIKLYKKWDSNPEAMQLIEDINQSNSIIFLTGKAGTGKTTLMKDLIDHFQHQGNPALVLASTGLASINIGGQTVHSFFGLPITDPHYEEIKLNIKKDKLQTLVDSSFIIIDEISMLSANLLDCIDHKIRGLMSNHLGDTGLKNIAFAGKKILLVGDLFQLPPISKDTWKTKFQNTYKSEFFFDSFAIQNSNYKIIELRKNYRQGSDKEFGDLLDKVRIGTFGKEDINTINTRVSNKIDNFGILLTTTNYNADSFNATKLAGIDKPLYRFNATTNGIFPENMKKVPEILELKEGAQIIMLNNDPYKQWVNGDLGIIESIDEENNIVNVSINNQSFDVEAVTFKNIESNIVDEEISNLDKDGKEKKTKRKTLEEKTIGTYEQLPMKLARAITIHKSQGLTFDQCCIDMGTGAFANGQTYVALSRCRKMNGIKLKRPFKESDIKTDNRVIEFMKNH